MSSDGGSFYPAAKKVFWNPIVRWILGIAGGLIATSWTVGIWPFFQGWVTTRADITSVEELKERIRPLEAAHPKAELSVKEADLDDSGSLSHGKQVEWLIIRVKRLEMREAVLAKRAACLEAKLRMPKPHSEAAKAACKSAEKAYDDCLKTPYATASTAVSCALKAVFGSD